MKPAPLFVPALVAITALALVGCSASDNTDDSESGSVTSSLLPSAEGTTQYPFTVDTWAGDFVVEERPERVAVIGFNTGLDALQALDVTPVYALTEDPVWEWRDTDYFSQIEFVDGATRSDPVNFENIANANPDVIISLNYGLEQTDVNRLADIAPYVDLSTTPGDKADWRESQRVIGEVLDLQAAAEAAIDGADRRIAGVAAAHPEYRGKTVTVATDYGTGGGIEYYSVAGGTAESFMTDLGFAPNPAAAEFVDNPAVGDEALEKLDGDVLIVSYFDEETQQARESGGLFQRLPAVVEGRYHAVNDAQPNSGSQATWALRRGASALSLPWAAETISDVWLTDVIE